MWADRGAEFEAVFLDPVGQVVQQRWADTALAVALEDLSPVSAFPVIPGRRRGPGLWWSATTGRHVSAGSNAMRTQLMVLDRDPDVIALAGQPVRLLCPPHYLLRSPATGLPAFGVGMTTSPCRVHGPGVVLRC